MKRERLRKFKQFFTARRTGPKYLILIPIIIFIALNICTSMAARSSLVINIAGNDLPVSSLAGVLTSIGNICLVLMVLFYKKLGFIIATLLQLLQLPIHISVVIKSHSLSSIPGFFSTIFTVIMIIIIYLYNSKVEREQKRMHNLFRQTATAMVNAIDAKDPYTHGHSSRVAEYSKKLAEMNHKSPEECEEIYYTALLHDVGKIGIPSSIINKPDKLTKEEYEIVKQHPATGAQILENISEYPFLSIGAHYHHERYDGKGYPAGLKGNDIPELARIISVADAYDAMTSIRSYRDPIPQDKVREEIVKGTGTQFDPEYARLMLHLIDIDTEYEMKERAEKCKSAANSDLSVGEYRSAASAGILIRQHLTTIRFTVTSDGEGGEPDPSLILFDSLDGVFHSDEKHIKEMLCFEYGEIKFDGETRTSGARKMETKLINKGSGDRGEYKLEAVRIKDHALIRIIGEDKTAEVIIALPDSTRFMYICLTGEHCRFSGIGSVKSEKECPEDYIPRIAEPVSFIKDAPTGDLPNLQIDGYRSAHTKGIPIRDGLKLSFHAQSLPTARLIWHCPFIDIFYSDDGKVYGENYRDIAFTRFDGEFWECDPNCEAKLNVTKTEDFRGWDAWMEHSRKGYDATVTFSVENNNITITTENAGILINNTAEMHGRNEVIYAALTGDEVVITNIHIR